MCLIKLNCSQNLCLFRGLNLIGCFRSARLAYSDTHTHTQTHTQSHCGDEEEEDEEEEVESEVEESEKMKEPTTSATPDEFFW